MSVTTNLTSTDLESALTPTGSSPTLELSIRLEGEQLQALVEIVTSNVLHELGYRPEYMDTQQIAEYLDWPKKRIDSYCDQGLIPFHSGGRGFRRIFIRQEIDTWVNELGGTSVYEALMAAA